MPVRRKEYDRVSAMLYSARQDTQSAYDRLDQALFENGKLLDLLDKERERSEMLSICLTETLREALGMGQETKVQAVQVPESPEMPKAIREAIDNTFPGDQAIRQANESYAFSQRHRWDSETAEVVDEIANGASV